MYIYLSCVEDSYYISSREVSEKFISLFDFVISKGNQWYTCPLYCAAEFYPLFKMTVFQRNSRVPDKPPEQVSCHPATAGRCSHFMLDKGMSLRHIAEIIIIGIFPDMPSLIIPKQKNENHPVPVLTIVSIQLKYLLNFISSCRYLILIRSDCTKTGSAINSKVMSCQCDQEEDKILSQIWLSSEGFCAERWAKNSRQFEWCQKKRSADLWCLEDLQCPEQTMGQIASK